MSVRRGTVFPVVISFVGMDTFRFYARALAGQMVVAMDDSDVAAWTHNFTAGSVMTVSLPTLGSSPWSFDLTGTTPVVGAVASALTSDGITGLPRPWASEGMAVGAAPASPTGNPSAGLPSPIGNPQIDREDQKRQLELARLGAEKAKADADRARSDAERSRAEADRAQADAQVVADANAKAAEVARLRANALAVEQRKIAAQAKAERDAKGAEP